MNMPDHLFFIRRHHRICAAAVILALAGFAPLAQATDYYWDADADDSPGIGGPGTWDTATSLWRLGGPTGALTTFPASSDPDTDVFLQGVAGTLTLGANIFVNDLNVAPASGTSYVIAGPFTLTLNGAARTAIDVASGASLTVASGLAGANGLIKSGAGTLLLDSVQGTSNLTGAIAVTGGTLQAGSSTNNAASQVLRGNAVDLATGTMLTTIAGGTIDLRVGNLSGAGSVIPASGGAVNVLALGDSTFFGAITTTGGLNLRGGNGATQTFAGDLTGLTGAIGVNSGAIFLLSGTGDSTSGVLGSGALAPRGGAITLDNSGGNTNATAGRISDAAAITFGGGSLNLIGNSAGTPETVGAVTFNAGLNTVSVTSNSTTAPTTLTFTDTGSLRDITSMSVNFAGAGGTLGAGGNNPAIKFTGTPFTGANTGLFANTPGSDTTIGFAIATTGGDTNWAGYSAANGVIALANISRDQTSINATATNERTLYAPTANGTLTANTMNAVTKITPQADGLSLNAATFGLNSAGILFTGSRDFSITGTTGNIFGSGAGTKYIYTIDSNATLNVAVSLAGAQNPFNKSGAGYLNLNGASNQVAFTANQNINLLQGTVRATPASFGGGTTSAAGAFTTTNFYGGTLEIAGSGVASTTTFVRALNQPGTTGGGGLKWDGGVTTRGDGGFSAFNGEAVVALVTTIGGTTAAAPVWNAGGFVSDGYALLLGSTKSDSRVVFTNNIGLDSMAATNPYFAREIRVTAGTTGSSARLSGVLKGSVNADLLKTGTGTLELTGANTYAGNTLVQQGALQVGATGGTGAGNGQLASTGKIIVKTGGTLLLGGTSASTDRINNAAGIVLAGGVFNTGGLSEGSVTSGAPTAGIGALTLTANSVLDLGNGASILAFANSRAQAFNGTLSIYNWTGNAAGGGADEVFFGADSTGLRLSQLNGIQFYSGPGTGFLGTAGILASGEIVPVPEPATIFAGLLMVGAVGWNQRRRIFRGV